MHQYGWYEVERNGGRTGRYGDGDGDGRKIRMPYAGAFV